MFGNTQPVIVGSVVRARAGGPIGVVVADWRHTSTAGFGVVWASAVGGTPTVVEEAGLEPDPWAMRDALVDAAGCGDIAVVIIKVEDPLAANAANASTQ